MQHFLLALFRKQVKALEEKWILESRRGDFRAIGQRFGVDPLIGKLLINRGLSSEEEMEAFLYGSFSYLKDPFSMKDGEKAARLLKAAVEAGQKIAVASDFDDDGIFSAYILKQALSRLGGDVQIYTPDRVAEGYGLNERIVREAVSDGRELLITCDNGIAAGEAVSLAKELGLTVIITDHHEVPFEGEQGGGKRYLLPSADAVVNPKQADCPYRFKGLCGAGVAFKVIQILYKLCGISGEELEKLLEYVAVATVADVMDIVDENRILVKEGLKRLEHTENKGLKALIEMCGLTGKKLTAYHVGFIIGPCFNAAGRLDTVKKAFGLLEAKSQGEASDRAAELKQLNEERKAMTAAGLTQALAVIEEQKLYQDPVIMVVLKDCHESLAGIIAGRIREKYHHPAYVFTRVEDGLKGSGRSIPAYSMYERLSACKELLSRFGGHAMAAGLSLKEKNFPDLRRKLCEESGLEKEDFKPVVRIDAAMPIQYVTGGLMKQMELLEPFGKGNPKPLFAEQHFTVERMKVMGKNRNALRLFIRNQSGAAMEGVWFGDTEEFFSFLDREYGPETKDELLAGRAENVDVAFTYYPEWNQYGGTRKIQLILKHYCRIR